MALAAGTRLGPYEVSGMLGAGGMGEVYRARDTRLDRSVAVKVLASSLVATAEAKARFEREAKVISQLHHPHICTLFDVGSENGTDFLVMELLEGESLSDRLKQGPMPLDLLLKTAVQIADALDKAHRAGIVHRDLKPGNVMLTKDGAKLLDFGLAKPTAVAASNSGSVFSAALTITSPASPLSTAGAIVGTVQYMSPEQIAGQEADARSDIFAFGLLLFEMATAKRAFDGKTQASVLGAVLSLDPPTIDSVQDGVPRSLGRLVQTCLAKDPDERYQTIHDVKLRLLEIADAPQASAPLVFSAASSTQSRVIAAASAAVCVIVLIAAASLAYGRWKLARAPRQVILSTLDLFTADAADRASGGRIIGQMALSPDGKFLAYVGSSAASQQEQLWIRPLASDRSYALAGTDNARGPVWSPDGKQIGFFATGMLKKITLSSGQVSNISAAPMYAATWASDDTILFPGGPGAPISRVPASGGASSTVPNTVNGFQPQFLPDGRHFVFTEWSNGENDFAVTASDKGVFVYRPASSGGEELQVISRDGKITPTGVPVGFNNNPRLSPDGKKIVYDAVVGGIRDVWMYDLDRKINRRLTLGNGPFSDPIWSPDGKRIAMTKADQVNCQILITDVDGAHAETVIELPGMAWPRSWSADGKVLFIDFYERRGGVLIRSVAAVEPNDHKMIPLIAGEDSFVRRTASISPDMRWVAYVTNESGREEVYVQGYPHPDNRVQVTYAGGVMPRWRGDGRELFYIKPPGTVTAVDVTYPEGGIQFGKETELFKFNPLYPGGNPIDVTKDGKIFVVNSLRETSASPVRLIVNWDALLHK